MARHQDATRHPGTRDVLAGTLYLLIAAVLLVVWLTVGGVLLLLLTLSTVVAGLVELVVGWPRLRRGRASRVNQR